MKIFRLTLIIFLVVLSSCEQKIKKPLRSENIAGQLPDTSYWNKPLVAYDSSDYVVQLKHMQAFYDVPGEFGHIAEGKDYGFESLSFILTNTQPNGGPPLHTHETEEAHVLHAGKILYKIGNKTFSADGPYIVRIPAGVPHTFINTGNTPLQLTAVFPSKQLSYKELGRNPLVDTTRDHRHKRIKH